ncbi:MAG TPA: uracil-DNA glycosylase [Chloroflexota bacterium]|nr:uracil-DNA glycosylase [Chloroflexota bacterium]
MAEGLAREGLVSQQLEVIAEQVRRCTSCRLYQTSKHGVPGEGNPNAEVMLVGEGPGFHEDAQGRPFVGPAGQLLTDLLARAGLRRDEVFITNVIKHRPPGNRDPLPDELDACFGHLEQQIAALKPMLIVTLGRYSMATFFGPNARISQVHGTTTVWRGITAYACYHPAAALHQPKFRQELERDFGGLSRALEQARQRAGEANAGADSPDRVAATRDAEQLSLF